MVCVCMHVCVCVCIHACVCKLSTFAWCHKQRGEQLACCWVFCEQRLLSFLLLLLLLLLLNLLVLCSWLAFWR